MGAWAGFYVSKPSSRPDGVTVSWGVGVRAWAVAPRARRANPKRPRADSNRAHMERGLRR